MFTIDKNSNRINKIEEKSFKELGFRERENLQEWLANNPSSLGEDFLVIQKEFDGFDDTRERLDLLALDKQGNIVIIENKLDDAGRDVTWQILKYASYCSSLSKAQILSIFQAYLIKQRSDKTAEDLISDFFEGTDIEEISLNKGQTQRLILVSGGFRKEVTSTVLWLLNYGLRIQCYKVTPYQLGEQVLLNVEQIIPMKEAEEYSIRMAEKTQEDISSQEELKSRHIIRRNFWTALLNEINKNSTLFQNISPSIYNWIGAGSGMRGVGYNFSISKKYVRVELYIDRGDHAENKFIFDKLYANRELIEENFGKKLEWERLEDKRASRIKYEKSDCNVFEKDQWEDQIEFLSKGMIQFERVFKDYLKKLNREIKM
jgi:hypothetical protein